MVLGHGTRETQWLWSHHYVQVHSKILPSQNRLKQRPHPPPRLRHELRDRQQTDATDCVRDKILFSNLLKPCTSMRIEANAAKWTSNWASLLVSMISIFLHSTCEMTSHSFKVRKRTVRRTHIRRGGWRRRYRHICSVVHTCHEKRWETTKLGCRHVDKTKPEELVNGKDTAHVRTGNGLSQNGYGFGSVHVLRALL